MLQLLHRDMRLADRADEVVLARRGVEILRPQPRDHIVVQGIRDGRVRDAPADDVLQPVEAGLGFGRRGPGGDHLGAEIGEGLLVEQASAGLEDVVGRLVVLQRVVRIGGLRLELQQPILQPLIGGCGRPDLGREVGRHIGVEHRIDDLCRFGGAFGLVGHIDDVAELLTLDLQPLVEGRDRLAQEQRAGIGIRGFQSDLGGERARPLRDLVEDRRTECRGRSDEFRVVGQIEPVDHIDRDAVGREHVGLAVDAGRVDRRIGHDVLRLQRLVHPRVDEDAGRAREQRGREQDVAAGHDEPDPAADPDEPPPALADGEDVRHGDRTRLSGLEGHVRVRARTSARPGAGSCASWDAARVAGPWSISGSGARRRRSASGW